MQQREPAALSQLLQHLHQQRLARLLALQRREREVRASRARPGATVVYTWAQSKDDKSAAAGVGATGAGFQGFMDNHHPELDYGLSDFDVDNRFVASYIYQLPFGRGKKMASDVNRAADLVIGGWETTGIATFQTGFPYSITANDTGGVLGTFFQRANKVSGCDIHKNLTKKLQRINFDCFSQPGARRLWQHGPQLAPPAGN